MIDAEGYSIDVQCDEIGNHIIPVYATWFGNNRRAALKDGRDQGWVLTKDGHTYCSRHCYQKSINKKC